jgi:hypothetical protein
LQARTLDVAAGVPRSMPGPPLRATQPSVHAVLRAALIDAEHGAPSAAEPSGCTGSSPGPMALSLPRAAARRWRLPHCLRRTQQRSSTQARSPVVLDGQSGFIRARVVKRRHGPSGRSPNA